MTILHVIEFG